jgi:hypothetical protein
MTVQKFRWEYLDLRISRPEKGSREETELVEEIFHDCRNSGFPYTPKSSKVTLGEFRALQKTPGALDLKEGTLRQNMTGLSTLNAYHPEMMNIRCRGFRTPMESFMNDDGLRAAIRWRLRRGPTIRQWGVRKALCTLSGTQSVSAFAPAVAKALYDHFHPELTLDFCAGWGGRMLGAMASGIPYVGLDPHTTAQKHNLELYKDLSDLTGEVFPVTLLTQCAEEVLGKQIYQPDLIFTSPPYFDVEKYSLEETQSYLRYPTEECWYRDFLGRCIQGSWRDLRPGGHLVLNVNPDMADRTTRLAIEAGFTHIVTWKLTQSMISFNRKSAFYRYEPILVFQKPGNLSKTPRGYTLEGLIGLS